jgi:hypothetical protein
VVFLPFEQGASMKRVALVELSVFERIAPLVSGYLQAYATTDDAVRAGWQFQQYTTSIKTPAGSYSA